MFVRSAAPELGLGMLFTRVELSRRVVPHQGAPAGEPSCTSVGLLPGRGLDWPRGPRPGLTSARVCAAVSRAAGWGRCLATCVELFRLRRPLPRSSARSSPRTWGRLVVRAGQPHLELLPSDGFASRAAWEGRDELFAPVRLRRLWGPASSGGRDATGCPVGPAESVNSAQIQRHGPHSVFRQRLGGNSECWHVRERDGQCVAEGRAYPVRRPRY